MAQKKIFLIIFVILSLAVFAAVFVFIPKLPQSSNYHQFSDTRKILGIPNFANVISNLAFTLVSIIGFWSLWQKWKNKYLTRIFHHQATANAKWPESSGVFVKTAWLLTDKEAMVFLIYFIGVFLTSIGSAYYHWSPNNDTLVWDRLPMTVVFMSLLSLTLMTRVDFEWGFWLLIPLIIFGIFSVLYWHWTDDLRLYAIDQFYTIFLLILILCFFPKSYPPLKIYIGMFIFYGLAKLFEHFDLAIYQLGEVVSGHTLKHIFSAISTYGVVMMLNFSYGFNRSGIHYEKK